MDVCGSTDGMVGKACTKTQTLLISTDEASKLCMCWHSNGRIICGYRSLVRGNWTLITMSGYCWGEVRYVLTFSRSFRVHRLPE